MNTGNAPPSAPAPETDAALVADHLARLGSTYARSFPRQALADHAAAAAALSPADPVRLFLRARGTDAWDVTLVAPDFLAELSVVCGLFTAHGLGIEDGKVFTYSSSAPADAPPAANRRSTRQQPPRRRYKPQAVVQLPDRRIVDWFHVRAAGDPPDWSAYEADLRAALALLAAGDTAGARGLVASRVADRLRLLPEPADTALVPATVETANDFPEPYTRIDVRSRDSSAFLYELCNALSMCEVSIERVEVWTRGDHVHDILYVAEPGGGKVTSPRKLNEIRAASLLIKQFTHLLPRAPDPRLALVHFGELMSQVMSRTDWAEQLSALEAPDVIHRLARLLGVSDFLWEDFLRQQHDQLMPLVCDSDKLEVHKHQSDLRAELALCLADAPAPEARRQAINEFKDHEMFRIDMRHILGKIELWEFGDELTDLTEAALTGLAELCYGELTQRFGEPRLEAGEPCSHSICGLGKFGGKEMGYGSDVELMFLYEGAGRTEGPEPLTNAEFFERLVSEVRRALRSRREGIFEPDLRLRPYGRKGPLSVSLEAFQRYFLPGGSARQYERQALIKLRPVTGPEALRERIVALRDQSAYAGWPFDVAEMRALRQRQVEELVRPGAKNAKFSPGGLVDVEYTTQALQIVHGPAHPEVREVSTRRAIRALESVGVLEAPVAKLLRESYEFFRRLIDALRMVRGNARDLTVPSLDSDEFLLLGRRLGYADRALRERLVLHLHGYLEVVQELSAELLP